MGLFDRLFRKRASSEALSSKDMMIAQVAATHAAWYPLHNNGCQAPEKAKVAWINMLQRLDEEQIILFVGDHKARNAYLGKTWPRV